MAKYEALAAVKLTETQLQLRSHKLPELVHLDDPAVSVMLDYSRVTPQTIGPNVSMDDALHEMEMIGAHLLLVVDEDDQVIGILSAENILGERPIKLIQERRIDRASVRVKMVMVPIDKVIALDSDDIKYARVGNIVNTLSAEHQRYALVVQSKNGDQIKLRGLFTSSQISKQLHRNVTNQTV